MTTRTFMNVVISQKKVYLTMRSSSTLCRGRQWYTTTIQIQLHTYIHRREERKSGSPKIQLWEALT